ncbi:MAG TPA: polyprenyl synthetase family protein [Saprospiraceae bacterium]|nr:polyprenyl synthetase family protein [Saprospiraceae bacterium]
MVEAKIRPFDDLIAAYQEYSARYDFIKDPVHLYEPVGYIMRQGGKKIRPLALLMVQNTFIGNIDTGLQAALALEMFHNFTLMHDDIMDNAETRRGQSTVFHKYGLNAAILSGDVMLVEATQLINICSRENQSEQILELFLQTAKEVCEGQRFDMDFEQRETVSLSEYLEMIRLKTSVLLAASLKMGALLSKCNATLCETLYELGINLGLGFQIHDDWLDFYGDSKQTGKKIGGDILQGKKSILILTALQDLDHVNQHKLLNDYKLIKNDEDRLAKIGQWFEQLDIKNKVSKRYLSYQEKCEAIIQQMECESWQKNKLREFVTLILDRKY